MLFYRIKINEIISIVIFIFAIFHISGILIAKLLIEEIAMLIKTLKNKLIGFIVLAQVFCANTVLAEESIHWSYVGRSGPDHWSELDKKFELCKEGILQSPINLDKLHLVSDKEPLMFHYESYSARLKDFSLKINPEVSKYIEIEKKHYKLTEFHFHLPSEHSINNKIYDAELHFVHQDKNNNIVVVAVLIKEGKSNELIKQIIESANQSNKVRYELEDGDLMTLIPENKAYFHYMGSLTTPPCTEGVNWYVLKTPIEICKEELEMLRQIMPSNARSIQDSNNRKIH